MKQHYFIAVCDILGFSDHIEANPLDIVVNQSLDYFRRSLNHSVHKFEFPSQAPPTSDLDRHKHVGVALFSDTVLFYTKHDTDDAIRELLATVSWLIFETIQQGQTRVRAGFAYGEAYIEPENSLFIGMPIVNAYRFEQQQQWAGGALDCSAYMRIPKEVRFGEYADWWLVEYDVPLKSNAIRRTLALNWNNGIHHPDWRLRWSMQFDMPSEADWSVNPSVCEKFVNTKKFHEKYCQFCRNDIKS